MTAPSASGSSSQANRFEIETIPYPVVFAEAAPASDVYGGSGGFVALDAWLHRPVGEPSDTVIVFMHPVGGGTWLPMVRGLARGGRHVIYANSRYRGADSALIMEKVVLDLGAVVSDAKSRLGYSNVVLGGWSGGGSLSMYYQQQAERPSVTATPAGDPMDLVGASLAPADAVLLLASHISRHHTLTEWMDASVRNESDPEDRDPELDLYNPENPNRPPYNDAFVERYRAAQIERNRAITAGVKERLDVLRATGRPHDEFAFVVHGTMADPRWLDPTLEPNGRTPGTCYLGDPEVVNNGPVGLARFTSLRSWLSQWSWDDARGDSIRCAADVSVPILVIDNANDDACPPSHGPAIFGALGHTDAEHHVIADANHYYLGTEQKQPLLDAIAHVEAFLTARAL